jgi:hippurate hydrolase
MIDDLAGRQRPWRQHLHQHPEIAFNAHDTAAYVASVLDELGFDVARGVGGTGVVGSLTRGSSTRAVALRADMDALPLQEVEVTSHVVGRRRGSMSPMPSRPFKSLIDKPSTGRTTPPLPSTPN